MMGNGVLEWFQADGQTVRHSLDKSRRILIGRDAHRDIQVPVPTVSGLHAVLYFESNAFWLIDAGSTNGTWYREQRLEPYVRVRLRHGDHIRLAEESFQFRTR